MQSVREKMDQLGLLQPIHKVPVAAASGGPNTVPDVYALRVGENRDAVRGVAVGPRYTVLQNGELADMADQAAERLGLAGDPIVRSWGDGRRVSVLLPIDRFGVGIGRTDITEARLRIDNPHGQGGSQVALDLLRLVCSNGRTVRVGGFRSVIPHTAQVAERVRRLLLAAESVSDLLRVERAQSVRLADRALSQEELRAFFLEVHRRAYGPVVDANGTARQAALARVADWVRNMEDDRQRVAGVQGTAWAALQSVTQWADHEAPTRARYGRDASADHGPLAQVKRTAHAVAVELIGAR